ncbi:MAG: pyridoxal phosphate-dependent aminotransferase [Nitrospinota bacterium]
MVELSSRLKLIKPSATMEITAKAKALKASGVDIIGFGAGEPDFGTPDFVKDAAIKALNDGQTKYTDAAGMPALREELASFYKRSENLDYKASNTIITAGGKQALYNLLQAIISKGDEVIIPAPYWVSYPDMTLLAEGVPIILDTDEKDNFAIDPDKLESLITSKTKAIILNSPSNPSGAVFDESTLVAVSKIALKHDLLVIADEIYKDIYYGDRPLRSLPFYHDEIRKNLVIVSGLSKNFSMTGWRIGWALADEKIIKALSTIQGQSTSNPVTFSQYGALAALKEGPTHIKEWVAQFKERRDLLVDQLSNIEGISTLTPDGAFYLFPNISGWFGKRWNDLILKDSFDVTKFLLEEAEIAVVPGAVFGADNNIRISYALRMEQISEGIERIKRVAKLLK